MDANKNLTQRHEDTKRRESGNSRKKAQKTQNQRLRKNLTQSRKEKTDEPQVNQPSLKLWRAGRRFNQMGGGAGKSEKGKVNWEKAGRDGVREEAGNLSA